MDHHETQSIIDGWTGELATCMETKQCGSETEQAYEAEREKDLAGARGRRRAKTRQVRNRITRERGGTKGRAALSSRLSKFGGATSFSSQPKKRLAESNGSDEDEASSLIQSLRFHPSAFITRPLSAASRAKETISHDSRGPWICWYQSENTRSAPRQGRRKTICGTCRKHDLPSRSTLQRILDFVKHKLCFAIWTVFHNGPRELIVIGMNLLLAEYVKLWTIVFSEKKAENLKFSVLDSSVRFTS